MRRHALEVRIYSVLDSLNEAGNLPERVQHRAKLAERHEVNRR